MTAAGRVLISGFSFIALSAGIAAEPVSAEPLVIAHRGASGYRPEHTLEAYRLAIEMGADYVEPDLVATKDGVLIGRHDCQLGDTTDVAERFPHRRRSLVIDGRKITDWFAQDFTLAEIRQLRARERLSYRSSRFNGSFRIPTFEEFLLLIRRESIRAGRDVGICPELKHSMHHRANGLPLEEPCVRLLKVYGYTGADSLCILQSFEIAGLQRLSKMTDVKLLQLLGDASSKPADVRGTGGTTTYASMMTSNGLQAIAGYAWGIGPAKDLILGRDQNNRLRRPSSLIRDAQTAGLAVIVYTMRNEPRHLAVDYGGDPAEEYRRWAALNVTGLFTDFPDTAVAALQE